MSNATWSGYEVSCPNFNGDSLLLKTKEGVRGINIPVTVTKNTIGVYFVTCQGKNLTVVEIYKK